MTHVDSEAAACGELLEVRVATAETKFIVVGGLGFDNEFGTSGERLIDVIPGNDRSRKRDSHER